MWPSRCARSVVGRSICARSRWSALDTSTYSNVYKCLTQHGTIVHTRKVEWDMETQLGLFPPVRFSDLPRREGGAPPIQQFEEGKAAAPTGAAKMTRASRRRMSSLSGEAIVRINRSRVYRPDGSHRPTEYIYQRLRAVDGLSVSAAGEVAVTNKNGETKLYSEADLRYDLQSGWIVLDSAGEASMEV